MDKPTVRVWPDFALKQTTYTQQPDETNAQFDKRVRTHTQMPDETDAEFSIRCHDASRLGVYIAMRHIMMDR